MVHYTSFRGAQNRADRPDRPDSPVSEANCCSADRWLKGCRMSTAPIGRDAARLGQSPDCVQPVPHRGGVDGPQHPVLS